MKKVRIDSFTGPGIFVQDFPTKGDNLYLTEQPFTAPAPLFVRFVEPGQSITVTHLDEESEILT